MKLKHQHVRIVDLYRKYKIQVEQVTRRFIANQLRYRAALLAAGKPYSPLVTASMLIQAGLARAQVPPLSEVIRMNSRPLHGKERIVSPKTNTKRRQAVSPLY